MLCHTTTAGFARIALQRTASVAGSMSQQMLTTNGAAKHLGQILGDGSSYQWPVLLCTVAAVLVVAIRNLWASYKARYSYYDAPSPTVRAPWWLLGNVEVVERWDPNLLD